MTQVELRGSGRTPRCSASRQGGLAVVSLEPLGGVLFDQLFVRQPLDGPDPGPGIHLLPGKGLRNLPSKLTKRIDQIFVATPPVLVDKVARLGERLEDRTPWLPGRPRLWPSDHAGVAARLKF